ncbi:hypothetical protein [Aquimarina agarilytica]|uniref:hypothetical protein n=1 Tax=Aquimarina agarilytica TaxID=1087449 RepID=UPI0002880C31|nr:hypothetical protein [Aquimarina agarilytica]
MDLATRKNRFIQQFEQIADINLIEKFESFLKEELDSKKEIVAYGVKGEPLTKEMYMKKVKDADLAMDEGKYISSEQLKKQMLGW